MGRILAIDYGRRRIGVALSDPTGTIASPIDALVIRRPGDEVHLLRDLVGRQEVTELVVGLPLGTDGEPGPMAEEVRAWARRMERHLGRPVHLRDERFSSQWADRVLRETGGQGAAGQQDSLAAQSILEDFLRGRKEQA